MIDLEVCVERSCGGPAPRYGWKSLAAGFNAWVIKYLAQLELLSPPRDEPLREYGDDDQRDNNPALDFGHAFSPSCEKLQSHRCMPHRDESVVKRRWTRVTSRLEHS